jgi:hypothetical protein
MNQQEWLESADPLAMLDFLFGPMDAVPKDVSLARKKLLLDRACFARLIGLLPLHARVWQAHAGQAAEGRYARNLLLPEGEAADAEMVWAIERATAEDAGRLRALLDLWVGCRHTAEDGPSFRAERDAQAAIIRDIYGNPFRPAAPDAACAAAAVVTVAKMIYEADAFECMGRLVEVLDEAGCTSKEVLDHCRAPGPHVRGCWVVDMILRKS